MSLFKERSEIITYTVNKNITSNVSICVQNGEVLVRAPWYLSRNQIQDMVDEKKRWILEKLKEYEVAKEGYIDSKIVRLLGKNYTVKIRYRNIKTPQLDLEENNIKITIPNKYKKIAKEDILKVLMDKMYQVVAEREIESAMEKMRKLTKMAPEDYEIIKMKDTLASCMHNTIKINPEIVKYSKEVVEYIVLHEFCHLTYKRHVKGFYDMIKKYMPNYERYAKEIANLQY